MNDDDAISACRPVTLTYMYLSSNDRFAALAKEFLPFAFIAKHDSSKHVEELFASSWHDNVGGSRAVLLYLQEIISLATQHLNAAQWEIKQTTSRAVADVVLSCRHELNQANAALIWPVLRDALGGKTWDGKEIVLNAFVTFVQNAPHFWKDDASVATDMQKLIIRESKRRNAAYRRRAFLELGQFADARDDVDMYSEVFEIVVPVIEDLSSNDTEMDVDSGSRDHLLGTTRDATIANAITALFLAINVNKSSRLDLNARLSAVLQILTKASLTGSKTTLRAITESEKLLLDRLLREPAIIENISSNQVDRLLLDLLLILYDSRMEWTEQIRQLRADATLSLGKLLSKGASPLATVLKETVAEAHADERSTTVRNTLDSASRCLE
ncbi:MAG: hypothetical protein M1812_004687 [Candelaria pacifica]|nr:MAG: hypothetical protein M1812_004687 [Candelaria pacifica]